MKKRVSIFFLVRAMIGISGFLLAALVLAQSSVEIEGVIKNGTTGRPVKNQRLILLSPSQGMEEVSSVVSDSEGRFKFERVQGPFFVVQTHYQGANYNHPLRPQERGLTKAAVTVYDTTASDANISVTRTQWRMVPESGKLKIDEVFEVSNKTDPPRTLVRSDGAFKFGVPAGVSVEAASLEEAAGMPLPQTPREILPGRLFAIDHPLQPGVSRIGIRMEADYSSQRYHFSQTLMLPVAEMALLLPKDMQVSALSGLELTSANTPGYQVFVAREKKTNETVALDVAGGSMPASEAENSLGSGDNEGQSAVTQLPNAIGTIQVPLVSLLTLIVLWSLGFAVFQRTGKPKKSDSLSPEKKKQLVEQKDYLIRRIVELDARFESKEISERDYRLQRSRLKSKCTELWRRLQPTSTRKREKTLA